MMKELILKKCTDCGAIVKVINDCECDNCGIMCCGKEMVEIKPNSTDAVIEKHVPTYEIIDDKIVVKVNHVMEDEHYIEWICFVTEDSEEYTYLKPNSEAIATYDKKEGTLYSYCNKHGLWIQEIN